MDEKKKMEEEKVQAQNYPLVSVVMPSYNHGKWVAEAIESVLNQTYPNVEFIVGDDGSTDNTVEEILKYEDRIEQIHLFDENTAGELDQYLHSCAQGKYVAIMHSDDLWEKDKLTTQVEYLENHPECVACFTGCLKIDECGEIIQDDSFKMVNMEKEQWFRYLFENNNCLAHPSLLIRREIYYELISQSGYLMFRQLPDFWMWLHLVQKYEIHIIEKELTYFRCHEKGANPNTSAVTERNILQNINESNYIWYYIFKNMDPQYFVKAFRDCLVKQGELRDKEILIEKLCVLLKKGNLYRWAIRFYIFDIYQIEGIPEMLENEYHLSVKDIYAFNEI